MKNKLILITGAGSGFGFETAKLFHQSGYQMILIDKNFDNVLKSDFPNACFLLEDVTKFEAMKIKIQKAQANFKLPIDLLVNNAGVMYLGIMGAQKHFEYDKMIDVNIKGLINGIEIVINEMKQRKHGTIINIASVAGFKTFPNHAVYCGTKYAVTGITETLRQEVAPLNIRVISICPGAFSTNLLASTSNQKIVTEYENWKKSMGKMAQPIEVAKIIKYVYEAPQELNIRQIVLHSTKQLG